MNSTSITRAILCLVSVALAGCADAGQSGPPRVHVFAASSLQTAIETFTPELERSLGVSLVASYAATSTLARQVDQGAPADVFLSADADWMDWLAAQNRIAPGSRVDLLTNQLVVIAPAGTPTALSLREADSWLAAIGAGRRLAVADTTAVPAGKYARAALESLGVWSRLEPVLAPGENVRAALQLVARAEAPLGIVYHTDAVAEPRVSVITTIPPDLHPAIVYPAALTTTASAHGHRVLTFLQGDAARRVFAAQGFGFPQ